MTLENKLGITDSTELAREEERISKTKAVELFDRDLLGKVNFVPVIYLETALENIEKMPQSDFDEIIEKYVEMNVAHPFREGNGRSMRIWLDHILEKELGQVIDWSQVDKDDFLLAMERSPIKDLEIKYILKKALSDRIADREMYMKGIDYSYYYEGYTTFTTRELTE